ncbi:uncharacterized protein [Zea mays]|uniref:Uncharacterized protein n=1 Tax=Zea mays TaxID=4577 RepID=A0A1D6L611_MAIZE|nr:uncharacterized protein LOC111590572 isoform X4 [Zea mays]ONM09740.1 hypothetical protein ZEAMMB73_Zm00001d034168 [Zea mays]|eukprot:XP_023157137.1 uncharacterized protein LOC111590572 isoform X4 [Zea mays]
MATQVSLVMWRAVFSALGLLVVATLVYTLATDGSLFHPELVTPNGAATFGRSTTCCGPTCKPAPVVSLAIVVFPLVPVEARFSSIASSAVQVSVPVSSPVMISQPMEQD